MENQNEKVEEKFSLITKEIGDRVLTEEYEKGTVQIWLLEDPDKTTKKGNFVSGFVKVETSVETLSDIAYKIAALAFAEGYACLAETKEADLEDDTCDHLNEVSGYPVIPR